MKKLIIAGSSKLQERAAYWRGYFEGRGYEVIDFPSLSPKKEIMPPISPTFTSPSTKILIAPTFSSS